MNSKRNPMSSIQCLDANQLIPDDRISLYGLLTRVSDYSQDDPVHSTEGLYRGIDIAHHAFKFPVAALALLYRHRRAAFIVALSGLARAVSLVEHRSLADEARPPRVPQMSRANSGAA
jgi:hypothetical protein